METGPEFSTPPQPARKALSFWQKYSYSQLKIGTRLTLSFAVIVLLMAVAGLVALWQFQQIRLQVQLLNNVDQKSVAVLHLHTSLLTYHEELKAAAETENLVRFLRDAAEEREELLADTARCKRALEVDANDRHSDPVITSTLQAIQTSLVDQIDTMTELAGQDDWQAILYRLDNQTKDLNSLSSSLIEKVDRRVSEERLVALNKIQTGQQLILVLFPGIFSLALLVSGVLGILVTRSITQPLDKLDRGVKAWAHGDFQYRVAAEGKDELAVLGQIFNRTAQQLHDLYEVLRSNGARFRSLIEHSSDLIILLDEAGIIRYVSPSSERLLGIRSEDLHWKNIFDFIHPADQDFARSILSDQAPGLICNGEFRLLSASGLMQTFEVSARNLLGDPAIASVVVNARDITERKQAEKALVESEEKYRAFFEHNLAGNYIAKADGTLLACNPAFVRMFGFNSAEEAKQTNMFGRFPSEAQRDKFLQLLQLQHSLESYEEEYYRKDGSSLHVTATATAMFNDNNEIEEISGFLIDETERRRTENYLHQAQKMEAIGRLAGGIAHDFNNLLGIILGCSSLLLDKEEIAGASRQELQEILEASRHGAALTRQLLAFSRKQVLQPVVINLNNVIEDLDKMLRRLIGEDIDIKTALCPKLAQVKADASQVEQVLLNLSVNARDAMPNGGAITIQTSNVEVDEYFAEQHLPISPGKYVRLAFSDTGIGMSQEILTHIFEPFFTTKGPEKGTGLGLSTVYGIVKQSGGHISAYSEPGRGTTFLIYLPAATEVAVPNSWEILSNHPLTGNETILLVEDAAPLRTLTRKILENCGYKVFEADGAEQALQVAEEHAAEISLLLTDVVMPHTSGPVLADQLSRKYPHLKILFMSGYADDAIAESGLLKVGMALLEKPFTMQALAGKIREILESAGPTDNLAR